MRRIVLKLVISNIYEIFLLLVVLINTILLCLNGILISDYGLYVQNILYLFCTYTFIIDMTFKIFGMGIVDYVRDPLNILDGVLTVLSIADLILEDVSNLQTAFNAVRVLRVFRILRLTRMLRSFSNLKIIMDAIPIMISRSVYLLLFLVLLNIIYGLIGMTLYGGLWSNEIYPNFNDYSNSFMAAFDVMTLENWNNILQECLQVNVYPLITVIYLISWIMIGNYVFLNLLLDIIVDVFAEQSASTAGKLLMEQLVIG